MEGGYFRIGRFGGAPIRIHWTAPLGAFVICGFRFAPAAWAAFVVLILVHELGHALFVRRFRLALGSVDVHGVGGVCQYFGTPTPLQRALIAWGGVLAQAVLLLITFVVSLVMPIPNSHVADVFYTFIWANLYLIALNLLPIGIFDGVEAWKLFGRNGLPAWWRSRSMRKSQPPRGAVVRAMPARRRFISNDPSEDILENTPTSTKRPPPHMLN
jgi:stage IV sporulation protein FB